MTQDNTAQLGTERVGKLLFRLAVPTIAAQIINLLYNVVDRMYIGHMAGVGKLALTGVGVCMPLITLITAFAALMSYGGAPRASIFLGRGDRDSAEKTLGGCAALLVAAAVVLTVVFSLFARDMLMLFGASENTIGYAVEYMRIYSLGTLFVQLTLGLNVFITAQGKTKIAMLTVCIGCIMNVVLDPVFIYLLDMGVRGAALATVISQAASAVWSLRFLTGSKASLRLKWQNLRPSARLMLPCLALGASPFIMQATEGVISVCFNASLLKYGGDLAVAAMTILSSIMHFSMMPLIGLAQGAQPIVSYNLGAGNGVRVREAFKILLICCVSFSTLCWAAIELFPAAFIRIFNSDPELVKFGSRALRIYMSASGIFGIQLACQQTFVALGNAKSSLFLALLRKVILLIPLIYIMPLLIADKTAAVFIAEPVADTISVITTAALFFTQFRRLMSGLENKKA